MEHTYITKEKAHEFQNKHTILEDEDVSPLELVMPHTGKIKYFPWSAFWFSSFLFFFFIAGVYIIFKLVAVILMNECFFNIYCFW
jgi:hypothetical protein